MYNTYELDHNIEMMNKLSAVLENIQLECDYLTMTEAVEGESSETTEKKKKLNNLKKTTTNKWYETLWETIKKLIEDISKRIHGGKNAVVKEDVDISDLVFNADKIDKIYRYGGQSGLIDFYALEDDIKIKKRYKKGDSVNLDDLYKNLNKLKDISKKLNSYRKNSSDNIQADEIRLFRTMVMTIISDSKKLLSKSISSDRLEKKDARAAKKVNNKSNNESVYYKEDNIMNKNEYIASIMLEAADLLKNDNNSLNEGIVPIVALVSIISLASLYKIIEKSIKTNKLKRNETELSKYEKSMLVDEMIKCIKKAKSIKYKKNLPEVLKTNINIIKATENKLKEIDNKLFKIKTSDEFYKIKDSISKKYNDLYNNTKKMLDKSNERLKNNDEWIENHDIINDLVEYITIIKQSDYYRNLDGDDFHESFDLFTNMKHDDSYYDDSYESLYDDVYNVFTSFDEYMVGDMTECLEPLKHIKIKVK